MLLGMRSALLGSVPALNLPFALTGTLDPRITFSRPSLATMYDSTGKLTYAPNNLLLHSNTFTNAVWTKTNSPTLLAGVADPVGGTAATRITTTANDTFLYNSVTAQTGVSTLSSIWVRRVSGSGQVILFTTISNVGSVITPTSTWAQYSTSGPISTGTDVYCGLIVATAGDVLEVYAATASVTTYETAPRTADQVITTSAAYYGPRFDYNPATLVARGLLIEEARTNICLRSQEMDNASWIAVSASVTPNALTAPDGTTSAEKIIENSLNATHYIYQSITFTTAAYTLSVYAKAGERSWLRFRYDGGIEVATYFNLATGTIGTVGASHTATMTAVGNGWYRCTVTRTATAGTEYIVIGPTTGDAVSSYLGDGVSGIYAWGSQAELGSFATSYIPTAASAIARSADSVSMTGTNFSSWYNQTQGTFVVNSSTFRAAGSSYGSIIEPNDGTASNRISLGNVGVSGYQEVQASGAQQALWNEGTANNNNAYASNASVKLALAYATNDANRALDGTLGTTDATFTPPVVNRMDIGSDFATRRLNGHIASLAYYNTRLPNATLQSLTLPVIADYYFLVTAGGDQLTDASGNALYTIPLYS